MDNKIEKLINEMSVAEKALLLSGRSFWFTRGIKKYGIMPYMVSDGPHGLRKQSQAADNLGINDSVKATCFPVACTLASTWNKDLIFQTGVRIGEEAKAEQVGIVLGPGANIKRSPLGGRNFEYFSEDPFLSSSCATALIKGVQSQGIGCCIKHFAVNNQEANRFRIDAVVDQRALREIYLASFEDAIKEAKPYAVMCAYNKVNSTFASENKFLLTDILRGEWGFDGYVMSDWGAVNDKIESIKSGLELEMPGGSGESVHDVISAVAEGRLKMEVLNNAVKRLLNINFKCNDAKCDDYEYDKEEHHDFAKRAAVEGAVLLKNDSKILPLKSDEHVTVIGSLFENLRYQGNGSSLINAHKVVSAYDAFKAQNISFSYAKGYSHTLDTPNEALMNEAYELAAKENGKIIVFAGLTALYESEGFDRPNMSLPRNQNVLIERLIGLHKNIIVVLFGGSPVEMPWINGVDSVLNMNLPGQAGGEAAVSIIFGQQCPSGKLSETFPLKLEDNSSFNYFPEGAMTVEYRESIFVGYRYYDSAAKKVLFPFGHGLSYTEFSYDDIKLSNDQINDDQIVRVSVKIKNIGQIAGKEIVQLYVKCKDGKVFRPEKELKGFEKIYLEPNEEKYVEFELKKRSFSYFNVKINDWAVESGEYEILVGASSRDIRLHATLNINAKDVEFPYDMQKISDYYNFEGVASNDAFEELLGYAVPNKEYLIEPIRWDTYPLENKKRLIGRLFTSILIGQMSKGAAKGENEEIFKRFMIQMVTAISFRGMAAASGGALSKNMMGGLIMMFNGKYLRGLARVIKYAVLNRKYDKMMLKIENFDYKKVVK